MSGKPADPDAGSEAGRSAPGKTAATPATSAAGPGVPSSGPGPGTGPSATGPVATGPLQGVDLTTLPILVVDDEPDNLDAFRFSFRRSFRA
jgi:hypothetical protein